MLLPPVDMEAILKRVGQRYDPNLLTPEEKDDWATLVQLAKLGADMFNGDHPNSRSQLRRLSITNGSCSICGSITQ